MPTLHTFGCSLSSPYELFLYDNLKLYTRFHNNSLPKIWPELLSNKLNLKLNNVAEPASGNDSIFHKFINTIDKFESGDVVIIGWSNLSRFRWAQNTIWLKKTPSNNIIINEQEGISKQTINEIILNKSHKSREYEIYDYEKIISKLNSLIGIETYFWSSDERVINNLPDNERICKKYLCGDLVGDYYTSMLSLVYGEVPDSTIEKETNGLINDQHFGLNGQKYMCDIFFKHIIKYKNYE
jgi:hypothetical protein